MALIRTPLDGSNGVRVALESPQAFAGLRVPEPDIAPAGKKASLVRMPRQTLHMPSLAINQSEAFARAESPNPDGTIPAS